MSHPTDYKLVQAIYEEFFELSQIYDEYGPETELLAWEKAGKQYKVILRVRKQVEV